MTPIFCENCGGNLSNDDAFCGSCGNKIKELPKINHITHGLEVKPLYRLAKVFYIFCYLILLVIVYVVFDESSSVWNYDYKSGGYYTYNYFEGIWYAFWSFAAGSAFLKITRLAALYISKGAKPQWITELKKVLNPFY